MKKLFTITILLLGVAAFLLLSPKILRLGNFQDQASDKIKHFIGTPTDIGEISWHWLPFPSLSVKDIHTSTDNFDIDIPELQILPSWQAILNQDFTFSKIKLINPKLTIQSFEQHSSSPPLQLADLKISIKNGSIFSPKNEFPNHLVIKKNTISRINASLTFLKNRLKFEISGTSNFCQNFSSTGRVDLKKSYYRVDSQATALDLASMIDSYGNIIKPTPKKINISLFIEGITQDNFKIVLKGDIPSLKLKGVEWFPIESKQCNKISLERYDSDFFIKISDLELASPAFQLNGTISRRNYDSIKTPIWKLDLSAQDIDLSQSRNFVLREWGNNIVAKEVSAIVLGGKANSASYFFEGSLHDFENIEKMKIKVDVANSAILIPHINLPIDTAKGKIAIVDGRLTGKHLMADIGASQGRDASISLDLRKGGHAFTLDLNLDVDIEKLHDVLSDIVSNKTFHNEIGHFTYMQGRATGHLSLGKSLNNIQTTVKIDQMEATGSYDRIPWPLTIHSGKLEVTPLQAAWSGVRGNLGPHTINELSGSLDWQKSPYLVISSIEADIDANDLLSNGSLRTTSYLYNFHEYTSKRISKIQGHLFLNKATLSGPAAEPRLWNYHFDCASNDLTGTTPLFPENIKSTHITSHISNKKIQLKGNISLFQDTFDISANYFHTYFSKWSGTSQFTGLINIDLMAWLSESVSFPPAISPLAPLHISQLKLSTSTAYPETYRVAGRLSNKISPADSPYLDLNINHQKNSLTAVIDIVSPHNSGSLSYTSKNGSALGKEQFISWSGTLDTSTANLFLVSHPLQSGNIKGSFTISKRGSLDTLSFTGDLEAHDITWQKEFDNNIPSIADLTLKGDGEQIHISKAKILRENNIPLIVSGRLTPKQETITGEMTIAAEEFSSNDLKNLMAEFFDAKTDEKSSDNQLTIFKETMKISDKLRGSLNFSINDFSYVSKEKGVDPHSPKTFHFSPLQGVIHQIDADTRIIHFSESNLCGIQINGDWNSDNGTNNATFSLTNSEGQNFQTTLPCLGVKKSVIDGDIDLNAKITGFPDRWQEGEITIKSSSGIIRKMEFLSNIFSLINFTEIFAFEDLPNFDTNGLLYTDLKITGHIDKNTLYIDKATLRGKGLNLSGKGSINLTNSICDLTLFIAPFKMVDSVITNIPLVGRIVGGSKGAILTFPVKIEGRLDSPTITPISPTSIGQATFDFIKETLALPFTLFSQGFDNREKEKNLPESINKQSANHQNTPVNTHQSDPIYQTTQE